MLCLVASVEGRRPLEIDNVTEELPANTVSDDPAVATCRVVLETEKRDLRSFAIVAARASSS